MVSALCVIPLSLLLQLYCLHQALAASSREALEEVFIVSGAYSYTTQGTDMIASTRLVDIPALNQFHPVLFERHEVNGPVGRLSLQFYPGDGTYTFYNFTDVDAYSDIRNNLSSLTLDDLPSEPACRGTVLRVDNNVMKTCKCSSDLYTYTLTYTRTSEITVVENGGPHIPSPGLIMTKLQHFPLPESWLVGQSECVNPCGY